jgi:hypothetical protein
VTLGGLNGRPLTKKNCLSAVFRPAASAAFEMTPLTVTDVVLREIFTGMTCRHLTKETDDS